MNLTPSMWLIYARWLILIVYSTVSAIGVKEDTETHLGQSLGLTFAIIAAFWLPRLPMFAFVRFAPVNAALSSIGVMLCIGGMLILGWSRQCGIRCMPGASSPVSVRPSCAAARSSFS